jgi:hypothetical protein
MQLLKTMAVIAVLVVLTFAAADVRADQGVPKETEDGGIMTGLVIAYGEILEPPYVFEIKNDTLYINDIPYTPRKADPNKPKPIRRTEFTEWETRKYNFESKLIGEYKENIRKMSVEEANKIIYEGFKNSDMIAKAELSPKGGTLKIRFIDERNEIRINLASFVAAIGYTPPTREQILEGSAAVVKSSLEGDYTECFGYNYDIGFSSSSSKVLRGVINDYKAGIIDEQSAREQMLTITKKSELIEDILRELR